MSLTRKWRDPSPRSLPRVGPLPPGEGAPGAALLFTSGPRAGVALGALFGEPLYNAGLDSDDTRALLAAHGFEVVSYVPEDPTCGARTAWLAQSQG